MHQQIEEYIRRAHIGGDETLVVLGQQAQVGVEALNRMGDAIKQGGRELQGLAATGRLPAAAVAPLEKMLPLIKRDFGATGEALNVIAGECKGASPLIINDKGPITASEKKGRIIIGGDLYARAKFAAGAISNSTSGKFAPRGMMLFNAGDGDDADAWGWGATKLSAYHTNLTQDGQLPAGWWFEGLGIEVEIEAADGSENVPADMRVLGTAFLRWHEKQDQLVTPLTHLSRCVPSVRLRQETGSDTTAAVDFVGKPFVQAAPFIRLRDIDKKYGLLVRFPDETATLTKPYVVTFRLTGVLGVTPGGST